MAKQRVDQSVFALTCTRVNGKASRFIDNDQIIIFEENLERNRLWSDLDLLERRLAEINLVTGSDNLPRARPLLIEPNEPAANQLLKTRPGIFRKSLRKKLIEAQLCVVL